MAATTHRDPGRRDRTNPYTEERHLFRMDELDNFEVKDWEEDIRGVDMVDETETRLGTISELIVEPATGKVRYLDLELDLRFAGIEKVQHVLVPIGLARFDREHRHITVSAEAREAIRSAPTYTGGPFGRDYELALQNAYLQESALDTETPSDFYGHHVYDVNRFTGRNG